MSRSRRSNLRRDASLSPAALRSAAAEIQREFPLAPAPHDLTLVDVDPYRLQAWWHLEAAGLQRRRVQFADGAEPVHLVLRCREMPPAGTMADEGLLVVFDQEVEGSSGQIEMRVPDPGRRYRVELGLAAADGGWLALAVSDTVSLPPPAPAARRAQVGVKLRSVTGVRAEPVAAVPPARDPSLRGGPPDALGPEFPNPHPPIAPAGGGSRLELESWAADLPVWEETESTASEVPAFAASPTKLAHALARILAPETGDDALLQALKWTPPRRA